MQATKAVCSPRPTPIAELAPALFAGPFATFRAKGKSTPSVDLTEQWCGKVVI